MEKTNKKNQRTKRNIIVSAVLAILLCTGIIVGATFALFTSEDKVNVNVTSGKIEITAVASDLLLYSPTSISMDDGNAVETDTNLATTNDDGKGGTFATGGTVALAEENNEQLLLLDKMVPGDKVTFKLTITNYSNVKTKYRMSVVGTNLDGGKLLDVLEFNIAGITVNNGYSKWESLDIATESGGTKIKEYTCYVELPTDVDNDYKDMSCSLLFHIEQVQGNTATDDNAAIVTKANGNLTVTETDDGKVSVGGDEAQVIDDDVMSVTYPTGVVLDTTDVSTGSDGTKKTTVAQKLEYVGKTLSDTAKNQSVGVEATQSVASYNLTLPVADTNETLVTVVIKYISGLTGVKIYHNGALLLTTASTTAEYAEYNYDTGDITLHLLHASPIDIIYNIENAVAVNSSSNVQDYLDGKYGSIDGMTLVLTEGDYSMLYLRQTKTASTRREDLDVNVTYYPAYYRAIDGLTIKAADNATVTCDGIKVEAGARTKASNQDEMNKDKGFVSYLSLTNITIEGITFNNTEQTAIELSDTATNCKGSTLYVNNFTVKDCVGTGDKSNTVVHFLYAGSDGADANFCGIDDGVKGFNNITIVGCTMNSYYQAITWNNTTATLTNFTVSNNTFNGCSGNNVQISNKANCGTFTFDGNKLIGMNGRFVRLACAQSGATITVKNTTVTSPVDYDNGDKGQIFKVDGVSGFSVEQSNNGSWEVITNDGTTWVANGDTTLLPQG